MEFARPQGYALTLFSQQWDYHHRQEEGADEETIKPPDI